MTTDDHRIRLFIGTPVPAQLAHAYAEVAHASTYGAMLRWAPPEQWHVTALFIGERPPQDVPGILDAMRRCALDCAPLRLQQGRTVLMPTEAPTMLWVRFAPHDGLTRLHHALAEATGTRPSPHEPYWPHITQARARRFPPLQGDPSSVPDIILDRLVLFRSDPSPGGRVHIPLGEALLTGTGPAAPVQDG